VEAPCRYKGIGGQKKHREKSNWVKETEERHGWTNQISKWFD
jgi:hypothetical protein